MPYSSELKALQKSNRLRTRKLEDDNLKDFASNDYLGFASKKLLLEKTFKELCKYKSHAPKSSQLVNGYHPIHQKFEKYLTRINGFESAIVVGSGFLANMALLEALPRKKDLLILDEEYHASGVLASKLVDAKVQYFRHNDMKNLEEILVKSDFQRVIVAVEGIYSMSGDLVDKKVFDICDKFDALLVVDEAHSVGVVGKNLLGVFDLFDIAPKKNHIKMGTLGKAMGSYGAYILSSAHISEYLQNRAKSLIYTTAPSLFDIELAYQSFLYMSENLKKISLSIEVRKKITKKYFDYDMTGLIFPLTMKSSQNALENQEKLRIKGFSVGAIRPPTVENAMLRIIPRIGIEEEIYEKLCKFLSEAIK
jgi:8-amino-7-oxononanoate synthase